MLRMVVETPRGASVKLRYEPDLKALTVTLLKAISVYAPPAYRDEQTELPAGRCRD